MSLKAIVPGFPPDSFRSGGKYDDEEIYMHLEHFANENCIEDSQLEDVYDVVNAEDPEEIYEEMCKVGFLRLDFNSPYIRYLSNKVGFVKEKMA